jgi:tRNA1(Val) A37 N6-methylase TrmN6
MVKLRDDERLDYLIQNKLDIIQSPTVFSFSLDAVLLGHFVNIPIQKGRILDLCTGTGAVALLLSNRSKAKITGIEIQERLCDMAERSVKVNQKEEQITIIQGDIKAAPTLVGQREYDVVTCNPPYFSSKNVQDYNYNEHFAIARHEIYCSLEDVIRTSSQLLKQGGKAAFVHRPNRLIDLLTLMRTFQLEPKRLQFVYPKEGKEANMILVEGTKDGKPDLHLLPPLFVYNDKNEYTESIQRIFYPND